jgi:putative glutamine amidotransferase
MAASPVIGITTYVADARWGPWEQRAALVPLAYVDAVARAGGRPVLLPPAAQAVSETLGAVAGLILCGGPDIDPAVYGQERIAATARLSLERDGPELELVRVALQRDVPLLGICRGMQLLNVARGGTLHQHLPDVVGHDGHATAPGHFDIHAVQIAPDTRIGSILGPWATVMSGHHQGIDRVGEGLIVSARSPDGAIEAVEDPDRRFALGVLWHPEQGADGRLFDALVAAARRAMPGARTLR